MKIVLTLIFLGIVVVMFSLRAAPALSASDARQHLKNGALLIDVRTIQEFQEKHLTNAINLPLDQLREQLPKRVPDKSKAILLHCRSGRRSGIAEQQLRTLGYTNAFNIGSYEQAQKILAEPTR